MIDRIVVSNSRTPPQMPTTSAVARVLSAGNCNLSVKGNGLSVEGGGLLSVMLTTPIVCLMIPASTYKF